MTARPAQPPPEPDPVETEEEPRPRLPPARLGWCLTGHHSGPWSKGAPEPGHCPRMTSRRGYVCHCPCHQEPRTPRKGRTR